MGLPLVKLCEEILGKLQSNGDQVVEGVQDLVVQVLGEAVNLLEALFKQLGYRLGDVPGSRYRSVSSAYNSHNMSNHVDSHVLAMFQTSVLSLSPPLKKRRPAGR